MDRFIAIYQKSLLITIKDLKSNMDRFIVFKNLFSRPKILNLKSNMDRFIEEMLL